MFSDLEDAFFGVPGRWTMRLCHSCNGAYLDPRPNLQSIGRAYEVYYTHEQAAGAGTAAVSALSRLAESIIAIRDGLYRRMIWPDRAPLGRMLRPLFARIAPRPIAAIACKLRHLQPAAKKGARLLDVGCGNGGFLPVALKLGYDAVGIDLDPAAVADGRSRGLNVEVATFESFKAPAGSFNHIMLSHVLEHFHDPVAALKAVHRLLVPGGRLWLVQPNLGALGLSEFGPHWRGLEPPRHMTLMTPRLLGDLLTTLGFVDVDVKRPPYEAEYYYEQSLMARRKSEGVSMDTAWWTPEWKAKAQMANRTAFADPSCCESMTMIAFKAGGDRAAAPLRRETRGGDRRPKRAR